MTTHKLNTTILLAAIAVLVFALAPVAQAASIGMNIYGTTPTDGLHGDFVTGVAGVVPQGNWNNTDPGVNSGSSGAGNADNHPLIDDSGASSGASASWSGNGLWGSGAAEPTQDEKLMSGFLDTNASITISGIPYASYDVYAYFNRTGPIQSSTVSDGTTTYSFTNLPYTGLYVQTTDTGAGNPTANYAIFSGKTGASVTITNPLYLNGIQIVEATAPIPEPSTFLLGALGMLGLGFVGWRRRSR